MDNLGNYIKVYDNVIPSAVCENLITLFESKETQESDFTRVSSMEWDGGHYRKFLESEIVYIPGFKEYVMPLYSAAQRSYARYASHFGEFFPQKIGFENFRMKRYDPNGYDQFGWHVDVGDFQSARRFLVMFFYLNDVEEGGETEFKYINGKTFGTITPKCGRMVVFPPTWMFPHIGQKPISGPKYILSTYAHYQ